MRKRRNIPVITAFHANSNQTAPHNTEESFMNIMTPPSKKYEDITTLTKDKRYISKEAILLKLDLQFYWNHEISEESKPKA